MKKVLYITPHLSTGGCPKYLEYKISKFKDNHQIFVVEWQDVTGGIFVVQRNSIRKIVGDNFYSLSQNKDEIMDIIEKTTPDIIHFEEIAESFVDYKLLKKIWNNSRNYLIYETTHSSLSSINDKTFLPDKWIFPSTFCLDRFQNKLNIDIPMEVFEMVLDKKDIKNKEDSMMKLGLDPNYIHILNVGLFTQGKNQGELIEIARKLSEERVKFHFVGNQADNFKDYWGPIMDNIPQNCTIWGERSDVDSFYEACDIFYFSSIFELNPLVVIEALSWDLPVFMRKIHTYGDKYDNNPNVTYLTNNLDLNLNILKDKIQQIKK
jgi:glycosyltransferase involved in cell wall biosynthesis